MVIAAAAVTLGCSSRDSANENEPPKKVASDARVADPKSGEPERWTEFGKRLRALLYGACDCKTPACMKKNSEDMKALMGNRRKLAKTLEQRKKLFEVIDEVSAEAQKSTYCMDKLIEYGAPRTKKLEQFADEMCACRDQTCRRGVRKRFAAWFKISFKHKFRPALPGDTDSWQKSFERIKKCQDALRRRE